MLIEERSKILESNRLKFEADILREKNNYEHEITMKRMAHEHEMAKLKVLFEQSQERAHKLKNESDEKDKTIQSLSSIVKSKEFELKKINETEGDIKLTRKIMKSEKLTAKAKEDLESIYKKHGMTSPWE